MGITLSIVFYLYKNVAEAFRGSTCCYDLCLCFLNAPTRCSFPSAGLLGLLARIAAYPGTISACREHGDGWKSRTLLCRVYSLAHVISPHPHIVKLNSY